MGTQMYQSLSVLQMNAEELCDYLEKLSLENPFLEYQSAKKPIESRVLSSRCGYVKKHDGDFLDLPLPDRSGKTLCDYLEEQLCSMKLDEGRKRLTDVIIMNLDDSGYLPAEAEEQLRRCAGSDEFAAALSLLRSLEPAGVGAGNLSECLCIQLEHSGERDSAAYLICRDYLEHLAKNHINHISKALGISESSVIEAKQRICSLNPLPSNGFDDGKAPAVIIPDLILTLRDGEPILYTTEDSLPTYRINPLYLQMAKDSSLSEEERVYFRDKLEQARSVLSSVAHRKDTLIHCAERIIDEQWDFFFNGGTLRPLLMSEMADSLGVHLSTVSRTVRSKYISCKRGTFPLSCFFASEACGDTSDALILEIRRIINSEDPKHPLSDSRICNILTGKGYDIARRTVAKYREKGGIPPATGRKLR